jgi:hypothetical protein
VKRTPNQIVTNICFDPVQSVLYWTDDRNQQIFKYEMNAIQPQAEVFMKFDKEITLKGIAIDFCNRKLYWTNTLYRKATVEMTSLDAPEKDYKVIVQTRRIYKPHSIAVDHYTNRIFWVDDLEGHYYSVESAEFDGSDQRVEFKGYDVEPQYIAVAKDKIYFTDNRKLWKYQKNANQPVVEKVFSEMPVGLVYRLANSFNAIANLTCRDILSNVTKIKFDEEKYDVITNTTLCLNSGVFNKPIQKCDCKPGYDGINCELSICHNFCLNGACSLTEDGELRPICSCNPGYFGDKCEIDIKIMCSDYCINGKCKFENGSRTCQCNDFFYGSHCEHFNQTECCENGTDLVLCTK